MEQKLWKASGNFRWWKHVNSTTNLIEKMLSENGYAYGYNPMALDSLSIIASYIGSGKSQIFTFPPSYDLVTWSKYWFRKRFRI